MNLPLEARRWPQNNIMTIEVQWFATLPDAQEWIGEDCGEVIYTDLEGARNYMWIKP